jgi:S-methylmethionine-dependent homocysteine/selenocysteine methylase
MTPTDSPKYRHPFLPLDGGRFLTDGGLETSLTFQEGWDLPAMAAFVLLETEPGRNAVREYFDRYVPMAVARKVGFSLESPTWRANPDWGVKIGYPLEKLAQINRDSIDLMREIRTKFEGPHTPILISGCIGPRGDGYEPGELMSPEEAQAYHAWQIGVFRDTGCDCVTAMTITNINEAIGLARAAEAAEMPCVISFTVETDGRLPTEHTLAEAIETVDAETGSLPPIT